MNNIKINKFLLIIFILKFLLIPDAFFAQSKDLVTLVKCIDGDTATFKLNENEIKVRFLAIDTPETVHPTKIASEIGRTASDYTCNKLKKAKEIYLEYDPESEKTDKYNRILAWIWLDNILLQNDLIENGYAEIKYIYGNYLYTNDLYLTQQKAQDKKIGIWENVKLYNVIFNEGETKNTVTVRENEKIKEYIPTKNGYIFKGWFVNNEKFNFETLIKTNLELKAKFEKDFTLLKIIIVIILIFIAFITNNKKTLNRLKKHLINTFQK